MIEDSSASPPGPSPPAPDPELHLHLFALDYRASDRSALDGIVLAESEAPRLLRSMAERPALERIVLLMTCHRCEAYVITLDPLEAQHDVIQILSGDTQDLPWRHLSGFEAVLHLCRVACGLDSSLVGEGQVLGQVRRAWREAVDAGTAGSLLDRLFRVAISAGKRGREAPAIRPEAASLADAAVNLAAHQFLGLHGRNVLVIGSGEMGASLVKGLRRSGASVTVAARRIQRAADWGVPTIALEDVTQALETSDAVFSATGAPHAILSASAVEDAMARRRRSLLFVDLAVPPDVDPAVRSVHGALLLDVDDVARHAASEFRVPEDLLKRVEDIAASAAAAFGRWARARSVVPSIVLLREHAEEIRQAELARALRRLPDLTDRQRSVINAMASSIVNRLLHTPTVRLKQEQANGQGDHLVTALDILFAIRKKTGEGRLKP